MLKVGTRAGTEVRGIELVFMCHLEICGVPGEEEEIADAVVHESHAPKVLDQALRLRQSSGVTDYNSVSQMINSWDIYRCGRAAKGLCGNCDDIAYLSRQLGEQQDVTKREEVGKE